MVMMMKKENDKATVKSFCRSVEKGLTRTGNYCDPNEKDENNYWKIDVEKLNRKMIYANRIKNQGVKASKELI